MGLFIKERYFSGINENYPGRASWQIDANHTYNETVNSLFQGSEPVNVSVRVRI